jgi:hypothetical protein
MAGVAPLCVLYHGAPTDVSKYLESRMLDAIEHSVRESLLNGYWLIDNGSSLVVKAARRIAAKALAPVVLQTDELLLLSIRIAQPRYP